MNFIRSRIAPSTAGYERPEGLRGTALVIGFGRIGQIASQFLLVRGYDISIIDSDVEMIDAAREYNFKVHYGDGTPTTADSTTPGSSSIRASISLG